MKLTLVSVLIVCGILGACKKETMTAKVSQSEGNPTEALSTGTGLREFQAASASGGFSGGTTRNYGRYSKKDNVKGCLVQFLSDELPVDAPIAQDLGYNKMASLTIQAFGEASYQVLALPYLDGKNFPHLKPMENGFLAGLSRDTEVSGETMKQGYSVRYEFPNLKIEETEFATSVFGDEQHSNSVDMVVDKEFNMVRSVVWKMQVRKKSPVTKTWSNWEDQGQLHCSNFEVKKK